MVFALVCELCRATASARVTQSSTSLRPCVCFHPLCHILRLTRWHSTPLRCVYCTAYCFGVPLCRAGSHKLFMRSPLRAYAHRRGISVSWLVTTALKSFRTSHYTPALCTHCHPANNWGHFFPQPQKSQQRKKTPPLLSHWVAVKGTHNPRIRERSSPKKTKFFLGI